MQYHLLPAAVGWSLPAAELLHACNDRQPLLRALFAAAMQPSWQAVLSWAYLPPLEAGGPLASSSSSNSSSSSGPFTTTVSSSSSSTVCTELPHFLSGIQPAVAMAGEQLRLLQRLCPATFNVVRELVALALEEQQQLQLVVGGASPADSPGDAAAGASSVSIDAVLRRGGGDWRLNDGSSSGSSSSRGGGGGAALATLTVDQLRDMLPVLQVYQQQRQGAVERLLQQLAAAQAGEGVAALAQALQR
jgi:hypothetical protein